MVNKKTNKKGERKTDKADRVATAIELLKIEEIKNRAPNQIATLMLASFGFVAGLAWNEAIRSFIDTIFVLSKDTLLAKFIYALTVTLIIVIVSSYLGHLAEKKK